MYKPEWLSKGAEILLDHWSSPESRDAYDVVIVGSGYGGSVAAARLAMRLDENDRPLSICVLERGREHLPRTFPNRFSDLPGHVRFSRFDDPEPKGVRDGLFDLRIGKDVSVLVANGLGGGSLFNAGVVEPPHWDVFDEEWPSRIRNEWSREQSPERDKYYQQARDMLDASPSVVDGSEKYKQFGLFAAALKLQAQQANIAVRHDACVKCGDCATGCNVGARKTLASERNYLTEAWRHGVEIYTGATVSHVEKRDGEWAVFVGLTSQPRPLRKKALHQICARTVILAAGTLGSTEILMRSSARSPGLRFSKRLGERFSGNGDMISALYGQKELVNAAPPESKRFGERKVGPTITGIAHAGSTQKDRIALEELAIPGALRRVFEEVVTTAAMLKGLGDRDEDDHPPISGHDPAAVNPAKVERCQVFAAMGDDGAQGRLELVPGWDHGERRESVNDGAIRVHWPHAGKAEIYKRQDELLSAIGKKLGGVYLRNPLWQPIPAGLSRALSGAKPTGLVFSMHPLGGCRMADGVEHGVVDEEGRVFDPASRDDVHHGLLVLDGSIVPTALGINPLLTITALAERAIERYCARRGWVKEKGQPDRAQLPPKIEIERRSPARPKDDKEGEKKRPQAGGWVTALRLSERMSGKLAFADVSSPLEGELTLELGPVENLEEFLQAPLHPLKVEGTLRVREPGLTASDGSAAKVSGEVQLLVRGASMPLQRMISALWNYASTRGFADFLERVLHRRGDDEVRKERWRIGAAVRAFACALWRRRSWKEALIDALDSLSSVTQSYVDLASNTGEVRYLVYDLKLVDSLRHPANQAQELLAAEAKLAGRKTLRYDAKVCGGNPWRQLIDLELAADGGRKLGVLSVDPAYFFNGFASRLQIAAQRDSPAAWMDLAALGLFVARVVLKIHFWSFRLPDYQKHDPMRVVRRLPGVLKGVQMERHVVGYPQTPRDAGIFLPLTRYFTAREAQVPVLLIHGLGSGGIQFATPRAQPSLAQCLAQWGFDVWVAELRTSIAVPYSADQWTLDEVARNDIPRIVDFVLEKTRQRELDVVAHCIGSAMFCTAVLDGRLQHANGGSKIRRAALLQVGPLVTLSKGTRLRTLVAAPLVRFLPDGHLDFSVDDQASWVESAIDRLLNTYPYPAEEARHHRLRAWGRRNRHIANCNRWAAIDGLMIHHENLSGRMLDGMDEILGHANLATWTQTVQYGFLERLTDSQARNSYVTAENVRRYFSFPVRFLHGKDNDVFHPLTSWRSQELLKRVHGAQFPAEVRILEGYRHLDPLIGKNAEADVFRHVVGFLMQPDAALQAAQPPGEKHYYFRGPLIGPLVGYLRQENAGWVARIWARVDDLRSPAAFVLVAVFRNGALVRSRRIACPTEQDPNGPIESVSVGPIDTILCADVELGHEAGETYEIVVLSAHEAIADPLAPGHAEAEADAGKRRSAGEPHLSPAREGVSLAQALADPDRVVALRKKAGAGVKSDKADSARVTTPKPAKDDCVTFALASCRYPGWAFDREQADATFGVLAALPEGTRPDALFLVGDQIYADATAGAFDPKDRRERFYEAYREAWTAPHAREVLQRLPVYMMMDDHEAGNDWHPEDRLSPSADAMRREGMEAFRRYQWIHSPGNEGRPRLAPDGREILHYRFTLQGFPVFVCDTRTGRARRSRILDRHQFFRLTEWLAEQQRQQADRPKFVVSPSVVVPFLRPLNDDGAAKYPGRSDGWDGFPPQLVRLFSFILRHGINNVVFLCGDSHLSMHSEILFEDGRGELQPLRAHCIMGSPMYAPYPFANSVAEEYVLDNSATKLKLAAGFMRYRVVSLARHNSFTLVQACQSTGGGWEITSEVLPRADAPGVATAGVRAAVLKSEAA